MQIILPRDYYFFPNSSAEVVNLPINSAASVLDYFAALGVTHINSKLFVLAISKTSIIVHGHGFPSYMAKQENASNKSTNSYHP